ncbi:DivIVA domain-containing protein [Hamadaea flava]|uniref:DivIVA domain-containing protein n=1 Tax=Hamadaea flava TaxID=1742688 RepID=A0ABV8LRL1_9ACTN|nr:DivIVA domain-containing protein [Hamadaea flava]MCP2322361.1 DivIVA domain-containing protein [Hamadaea flava]
MLPFLIAAAIAAVFIVVMTLPRRSEQTLAVETTPAETPFTIVLRGYDREQVEKEIRAAENALGYQDPAAAAKAAQSIAEFRANGLVVLRGYDREQVDHHLDRLSAELARVVAG